MLLLAAIAAAAAGWLLTRASQEVRLATRSYYLITALNLAEAGVEEAMWAANSSAFTSAHGWAEAAGGGAMVFSRTSGLDVAQGAAEIHVRVDSPASANPIVTALGLVRLPGQRDLVKQLRVTLARRAVWANAIVAKGTVTFNGNNVAIDAYDSLVGPWNAVTNRLDQATVATTSTSNAGLAVNNADIYGYVATGGGQPVVGPNGSILGATSPASPKLDPSRLRTDFSYNIPDTALPAGTPVVLADITTTLTLPRPGDTPDADGRYLYQVGQINLNNQALTIAGPVDLVVTSDISIGGGSGSVTLSTATMTSDLRLYAGGNITLSGSGAVNATGSSSRLQLYGTRTQTVAATLGPQQFSLGGNAGFAGLIYAPNADVSLQGGGSGGLFDGAIVARNVTLNGNYAFHYDVRNASIQSEHYFRPTAWLELTAPSGSSSGLARDNREPFAGRL